jgi:hypothetical protein
MQEVGLGSQVQPGFVLQSASLSKAQLSKQPPPEQVGPKQPGPGVQPYLAAFAQS